MALDALELTDNKPIHSKVRRLAKPTGRTRVTNGRSLLGPGVDGRSLWARRFRDVLALHLSDLGGEQHTSEAEKSIARRAACLVVELEQMEIRFATGDTPEGEETNGHLIDRYQRCANTLRRLLESLGLQRRQKDITTIEHDRDEAFRQEILGYLKEDDAIEEAQAK
jgi:hypothetical protein